MCRGTWAHGRMGAGVHGAGVVLTDPRSTSGRMLALVSAKASSRRPAIHQA